MESKELPNFVLMIVLIGMVLGIGLVVLINLQGSSQVSTIVTNETIAISGGAGTTAFNNLTSVSFFGNATVNTSDASININQEVNWTTNGAITVNTGNFSDLNYRIDYTYDRYTEATNGIAATISAILTIPTTWIGLIITVAMLGIILLLVIRSFTNIRR